MTVTQIEPFSRGKGRVAIYLNNSFSFVLYKGELLEYGIEVGKIIDDELYNRILNEKLYLRCKKRAMNLLMKMDRCESDVRRKLTEGGYPQEAVDVAIEYLKSFHYIDDYRYVQDYMRYKSSTMSRKQIINKLSEKGIARSVIEEVLCDCEDDGRIAEKELILKLMNKRCKGRLQDLGYEEKQKLFAYLYNKGFSIGDIERVYNDNCLT